MSYPVKTINLPRNHSVWDVIDLTIQNIDHPSDIESFRAEIDGLETGNFSESVKEIGETFGMIYL